MQAVNIGENHMSKKFNKLWYQEETSIHNAVLFNLRDNDLVAGGLIQRGEIVLGQCGYAVAESAVPGFRGEVCEYQPNRCVDWHGHYLTCMALDALPAGSLLRKEGKQSLRHKHYVVAEMTSGSIIGQARKMGLPVIQSSNGQQLVNLEIFTVPGRTPECRRAKLL